MSLAFLYFVFVASPSYGDVFLLPLGRIRCGGYNYVWTVQGEKMELARGIEPPTSGLQNRCSAIELRQPVSQW